MRWFGVIALAIALLFGAVVYLSPASPPLVYDDEVAAEREPAPSAPAPQPRAAEHDHPEAESGQRHPITPEREHLQRELQLIGALNDAVDLHDVATLRTLIERYREHDPADENKMQEGYARIADCLQEPGEPSRARAQAYYDTERASTLRRYVRRACLER